MASLASAVPLADRLRVSAERIQGLRRLRPGARLSERSFCDLACAPFPEEQEVIALFREDSASCSQRDRRPIPRGGR